MTLEFEKQKPMTIALSRPIESQNQRDKWHWTKRDKERVLWEWEIFAAINGRKSRYKHNDKKRYVKITSLRPQLLDRGDLWGGAKGLVDALVNLGMLKDDSDEWCDLEIVQVKQSPKGTIIDIKDL